MALCIEPTLQSSGVRASLSTSGIEASMTPKSSDAYFAVVCPIDTIASCFSLGGWDDELGWDDNLGWND